MRKIIVDNKNNGKLLSTFLLNNFDGLTTNLFYKTLRKKDIRINDKKISENVKVYENDEVTIFLTDEYLFKNNKSNKNADKNNLEKNNNIIIDFVYEDENILVVNKPQGISVTENSLNEETLEEILSKKYSFIKPCHRLDRNTSGLVVFAKNEESLNILLDKFKKKEIDKKYICDVYGILEKKEDTLIGYLFKDTKKSIVYVSSTKKKNYQEIITKYKVISENKKDNFSTLEVSLITGRTHQIRAHLSFIGHPIIGDRKIW